MAKNTYSWSTPFCQMARLSQENSALRAKVEAQAKELSRYQKERDYYSGLAIELVVSSRALCARLQAHITELKARYQLQGKSLDAKLQEKEKLWTTGLDNISMKSTLLQQSIYISMKLDGQNKSLASLSQSKILPGTNEG